jgi:hypothetical protein
MSNMNITRTNIINIFIYLYYNSFTVHDLYRKHCLVCVKGGGGAELDGFRALRLQGN